MPSWPPGWVGALAPVTMHFATAPAFSTWSCHCLPTVLALGPRRCQGDTSPGTTVPIPGEKAGRDAARTRASPAGGGTGGQWGAG